MKKGIVKGLFVGVACSLTIGAFSIFAVSHGPSTSKVAKDVIIPTSISHNIYL
ncbi:hypothetical protein ACFO4N_02175 [Camelliibacillus cellulosilyticus]|uniref:Phr family secreted Rap phosphatase inhibitor n=1 Tax=Camelliibacillus cellulosilyticus TaxID=2174486 RepID=A0ABV9GGW2_9BACL